MTAPRVRFAPSPTGYLHIGGARTALFNWLWARRTGGTFVLRIEDTDQARSTDESRRAILDSMRWLGLEWDEGPEKGGDYGPYTQTERLALYKEHAERLVAEGKAYRCYATKEELDALRKEAEKQKKQFFYPHIWRDKTEKDWLPGKPFVYRFKTPLTGATSFRDEVFGTITTPNQEIQDFILLREDGIPLYNFGAVVDDVTMKITLVARGRDHVINTAPQVMLYEALGYPVPQLAHLPMMLAPDGKKLSKREAERYDIPVSVTAYRDRGFTPDALLNYLARFGWSHGDQEVFTRRELIDLFDFKDVNKADGKFDMKKCLAISFAHLKSESFVPAKEYAAQVRARLTDVPAPDAAKLDLAVKTVRERARTFVEAAEAVDFYFRDPPRMDEAASAKFLGPAQVALLTTLAEKIEAIGATDELPRAEIDAAFEQTLAAHGLAMKDIGQPVRVALSGKTASPSLTEVIEVLGKAKTVARLRAAADLARSRS